MKNVKRILDINDSKIDSAGAVVFNMYDYTSKDGQLLVSPLECFDGNRFIGYFNCKLDKARFDKENKNLSSEILRIVETMLHYAEHLVDEREDDEEIIAIDTLDILHDSIDFIYGTSEIAYDEIRDNYFTEAVRKEAENIIKLFIADAPLIVVNNWIKRFAYYYVLNRYLM